jgi:hypothetical protein
MPKLTNLSQLTSKRQFNVSLLDPNDATGGLEVNVFYPAEVKLWKREYGETHATALRVFPPNSGEYYYNEYNFTDLADFNRKFNLQNSLSGGSKSKKNRRKSKKNLRKSNRRRYR